MKIFRENSNFDYSFRLINWGDGDLYGEMSPNLQNMFLEKKTKKLIFEFMIRKYLQINC